MYGRRLIILVIFIQGLLIVSTAILPSGIISPRYSASPNSQDTCIPSQDDAPDPWDIEEDENGLTQQYVSENWTKSGIPISTSERYSRVVSDSQGRIHAIWFRLGTTEALVYSLKTQAGWETEVLEDNLPPYSYQTAQIRISSTDDVYIAWSQPVNDTETVILAHGGLGNWTRQELRANCTLRNFYLDSDGSIHLLWFNGADLYYEAIGPEGGIYYVCSNASSSPDDLDLVAEYRDEPHIIWCAYRTIIVGYTAELRMYHSFKNNTGWHTEVLTALEGYEHYPSLETDGTGVLHLAYVRGAYGTSQQNEIVYAKCIDSVWLKEQLTNDGLQDNRPDLLIGQSNTPMITWVARTDGVSGQYFRVVFASRSAGLWSLQTVTTAEDYHDSPRLTITPPNIVQILFEHRSNIYEVMHADNSTGVWSQEIISGLHTPSSCSISMFPNGLLLAACEVMFRQIPDILFFSDTSELNQFEIPFQTRVSQKSNPHIAVIGNSRVGLFCLEKTATGSGILFGQKTDFGWTSELITPTGKNVTEYTLFNDGPSDSCSAWISENKTNELWISIFSSNSWTHILIENSTSMKRDLALYQAESGVYCCCWSEYDSGQWDIRIATMDGLDITIDRVTDTSYDEFSPSIGIFNESILVLTWNSIIDDTYEIHYGQRIGGHWNYLEITNNEHQDTLPRLVLNNGKMNLVWRRYSCTGYSRIMHAVQQNHTWVSEFVVEKEGSGFEYMLENAVSVDSFQNSIYLSWADGRSISFAKSGYPRWGQDPYTPRVELLDHTPMHGRTVNGSKASYNMLTSEIGSSTAIYASCGFDSIGNLGNTYYRTSHEAAGSLAPYPSETGLMAVPTPFGDYWNGTHTINFYSTYVAEVDSCPEEIYNEDRVYYGHLQEPHLLDTYALPNVRSDEHISIKLEQNLGSNLDLHCRNPGFSIYSKNPMDIDEFIEFNAPQTGTYFIIILRIEGNGSYALSADINYNEMETLPQSCFSYNDTLLIWNSNSSVSQQIADYFRAERTVVHELDLNCTEMESIDRPVYDSQIRTPLESYLNNTGLRNNISYFITTKGVPLKIWEGYNDTFGPVFTSVDSEIGALYTPETSNSYCGEFDGIYYTPFESGKYNRYLVTRLTGYDFNDVKKLIDSASESSTAANLGTFLIDERTPTGGPGVGPNWNRARDMLLHYGYNVTYDATDAFLHDIENVSGYISWGSNDPNYVPENLTFLPGSLGSMAVSTSARTFYPTIGGQNLIADLISEGITGVVGWVAEPYFYSVPDPVILWHAWLSGYNLAECFYLANSKMYHWKQVVVGDPKACLNPSLGFQIGVPRGYNISRTGTENDFSVSIKGYVDTCRNISFDVILRQPQSDWNKTYRCLSTYTDFAITIPSSELDGLSVDGLEIYYAELRFTDVWECGLPDMITTQYFYDGIDQCPYSLIIAPTNDTVSTDSICHFTGWVYDPDWDSIRITWISSIDGVLGNDRKMISPLSDGWHILTLNVTDDILSSASRSTILIDTSGPSWIDPPDVINSEYGDVLTYDLNASDISGLDMWTINNTLFFAIDENGMVTSNSMLPIGLYPITVRVGDTLGHQSSIEFLVNVRDTTSPLIENVPVALRIEFGNDFHFDFNASDLSGIDHWWINDTLHFAINTYGVVANQTTLSVGDYWLEVRAYDPYDNLCSILLEIQVSDTTDPRWDFTPTNQSLEYGNSFEYTLQASDISGISIWWINETSNFYVDGFGTLHNSTNLEVGSYSVDVSAIDPYGNHCNATILIQVSDTTPPSWKIAPSDQLFEYGQRFEYQLTAYDLSGINQWWLNDTVSFSIDSLGLISNASVIAVGVYGIEVYVNDTWGNVLSASFRVFAAERIPPIWNPAPTDEVFELGTPITVNLNAFDTSGIASYWTNDTVRFTVNGDGVLTNLTLLAVGDYWLEVRALDPYGNNCTAVFRIIVKDTTPPVWTMTFTDCISEYGSFFDYVLAAFDISGVSEWWISDPSNFHINESGVVRNSTLLVVSSYTLYVAAIDPYGNNCTASFKIVVMDTTSPAWIEAPTNQFLSFGSELEYQLSATDLSGVSSWIINYTSHFAISGTGLLTNTRALDSGAYCILITAYDPYGNNCTATIIVFVEAQETSTTTTTSTSPSTTPTTQPNGESMFIVYVGAAATLGVILLVMVIRFREKR